MAKSFAQKLCTIVYGIECYNFFKNTKSDNLQVATSRECNFIMGTILGKGFAQALVQTVKSTHAFGTRDIDSMHLYLSKTLSQHCPHAEIRQLFVKFLTFYSPLFSSSIHKIQKVFKSSDLYRSMEKKISPENTVRHT